jgi:hypothetical protein
LAPSHAALDRLDLRDRAVSIVLALNDEHPDVDAVEVAKMGRRRWAVPNVGGGAAPSEARAQPRLHGRASRG